MSEAKQARGIKTTSYQRRCDVMTSSDADMTLFQGYVPVERLSSYSGYMYEVIFIFYYDNNLFFPPFLNTPIFILLGQETWERTFHKMLTLHWCRGWCKVCDHVSGVRNEIGWIIRYVSYYISLTVHNISNRTSTI